MLAAWPQVGAANALQLWVGVFGTEHPPLPTFELAGAPVPPLGPAALQPIRDRQTGANGLPLNHQGVFRLAAHGPDLPHRVTITAGVQRIERVVHTLPRAVPDTMAGTFNLLLASCYSQPNDAGGLLGRTVAQLPVRPHLTLLAGDQIYGDLPLFEDLPEDEPALSRFLGDKYQRNWLSDALGTAGLQPLLTRAPTVCLPDDHEFWNNYPHRQAQLPGTWREAGRQRWAAAAQALYADYQHGGAPGQADRPPASRRIDVEPLCMLMLDTRCHRNTDFDARHGLMAPEAEAALALWEADLLAARTDPLPRIGLLAAGQALFVPLPEGSDPTWKDAELGNYAEQFDRIERTLERLATAGVPVVFLTGDVHWGRLAQAVHVPSGRALLYEVICSPARLIDTPGADQKALAADFLGGLFRPAAEREPWPRHAKPPDPPSRFGRTRQFAPTKVFGCRGDQIALVRFSRNGRGLDLQVDYHPVHADPTVARPRTTGTYTLLPY